MPVLTGFRGGDLPDVVDMQQLRLALSGEGCDCRYLHAASAMVAHTPEGLQAGVNVFGPGSSPVMTSSATSMAHMREVSSILLHDATFVSSSMTVVDQHNRLFLDGVDNVGDPIALAGFDPNYERTERGDLALKEDCFRRTEDADCIALPVCGIGFHNYGHFLYDGLPAVFLHAQLFPDLPLRIVGQKLAPWQESILAALELSDIYMEVRGQVTFRRLLASTLMSLHVSYPTPFVRPLFDMMRFRFGARGNGPAKVFMSRAHHQARRQLRNREAVETMLTAHGFTVVRMDELSVPEQAAIVGSAKFIVAESGAAMANIGFCQPGTKVLELQPERFVEGWTRGMCKMFSHRWHVYFARVDSEPVIDAAGQQLNPKQHFSFEIDLADLALAVDTIDKA